MAESTGQFFPGVREPWRIFHKLFCLVTTKGKGGTAWRCYRGCSQHFLEESLQGLIMCPLLEIVQNRKTTCVKTKPDRKTGAVKKQRIRWGFEIQSNSKTKYDVKPSVALISWYSRHLNKWHFFWKSKYAVKVVCYHCTSEVLPFVQDGLSFNLREMFILKSHGISCQIFSPYRWGFLASFLISRVASQILVMHYLYLRIPTAFVVRP